MTVTARRQPQERRALWIAIAAGVVLLLVILGIWAYVSTRPETALVARRDIVATLVVEGETIAPPTARAEVMLPFQAPVDRVLASVGDRVRRGDVLVELSYPSAQAAYEQTRQRVRAAETALENARQQYRSELEAAQRQLTEARAAEQAARQAAAGTAGAAAPPVGAETRVDEPPADGSVTVREPAPDLQQATEARILAEQHLRDAQATMEEALAPYRRELEVAREAFREAQAGRKLALVRAPISGTVLELNAAPGQELRDRRRPVAVIVDLSELQVQAPLPEEQAAGVRPEMPATLTFDQVQAEQFPGELARITTRAATLGGQRYTAIVDFRNEQGLVKPGMDATVSIQTDQAENVLAVPADAIEKDNTGRTYVNVLRGGEWQRVFVETGLTDGRYTEIRSGLEPGQRVQVKPDLV